MNMRKVAFMLICAALLSLLLFAAGHSGPGQMAAALVFGAACFFLLKKTGTLAAPVLFHALVNLAGCWI
jgi:membrane protease YdiL (CAAX protease family)